MFSYFLEHHEDGQDPEQSKEIDIDNLADYSEELMQFISGLVPVFTPNFLLLIDRSEGSKYQGFKEKIVDFFEKHYLEHVRSQKQVDGGDMKDVSKEGMVVEEDGYGRILSYMFVDGLIALIRKYMGDEMLSRQVAKHFMFFLL